MNRPPVGLFLKFALTTLLVLQLRLEAQASGGSKPVQESIEPPVPAHVEAFVKVGVVHWAPEKMTPVGVSLQQAEAVKETNRQALSEQVREAASHGASWVLAPEMSFLGYPDIPELPPEQDEYRNREDIAPYVEPIPGPSTAFFGSLAKELGIWLQLGLAERDLVSDRYYNAAVVFSPRGELVAHHRKVNLYEMEKKFFTPGVGPTFYVGPAGLTSVMICADVYDRTLVRAVREAGASVVALSASWAEAGTGMAHFRTAARRTRSYVVASNHTYFPDAGVVNPDGSLQSHLRQTTGVAYGYLPRGR